MSSMGMSKRGNVNPKSHVLSQSYSTSLSFSTEYDKLKKFYSDRVIKMLYLLIMNTLNPFFKRSISFQYLMIALMPKTWNLFDSDIDFSLLFCYAQQKIINMWVYCVDILEIEKKDVVEKKFTYFIDVIHALVLTSVNYWQGKRLWWIKSNENFVHYFLKAFLSRILLQLFSLM